MATSSNFTAAVFNISVLPEVIKLRYDVLTTIVLIVAMVMTALAAVTGNLLVIISIFTYRPLKTAQNVLIVSLAVADVGVALLVMPLSIVDTTFDVWFLGHATCIAWTMFDVFFCTASILNLCCIGIDRYQALCDPISYANKRTIGRMVIMILVAYGLSAVVSMPQPLFWHPQARRAHHKCGLSNDPLYVLISASVSFFIPTVIMCIVYGSIYWKTRDHLRQRSTACAAALSAVTNAVVVNDNAENEGTAAPTVVKFPSGAVSSTPVKRLDSNSFKRQARKMRKSLRKKASWILRRKEESSESDDDGGSGSDKPVVPHGNDFWQQAITLTLLPPVVRKADEFTFATRQKIYLSRERKAAKILGLLIVTFMTSWIPFFILYIISPWCEICRNWNRAINITATWIGYANSACNPILYTVFNADFRKAFHKLLCSFYSSRKKVRTRHLAKIWRDAAETHSRVH